MPRQQVLHERDRPLLQRLGEDSVVGVEERVGGNLPGGVPGHVLLVDEDAHELDNGESRVSVVELNGVVWNAC